jgi:protein-L-isoaspartate(D-aspartate) O-methyltransferase
MHQDTYTHKGQRKQLVDYLQQQGISDPLVLEAMLAIPRHFFIETAFSDFAYEDRAFPIAASQTISHPSTVAEQSQLLAIKAGEKVLEIGTGCGYQTAILVAMQTVVFSIERQPELFSSAHINLKKIDKMPQHLALGDGFLGLPQFAPYDKILVTCGAKQLPVALLHQLKIGGSMVIPIGDEEQILHRFTKLSEHDIQQERFGKYKFVPLISDEV